LRPRYLEIEGLQSFKEAQTVDFDKLSETGLFGIFGPTGSGKSTVLDAITLALYGNVQRASHGTQGIINAESDSVKVSFLFDILRNNDRKTYRVERVYRRKKGSDISAEARLARLFELDNDKERVIADKVTEVTEKVEQLLGLKLDDFTRSVVLPQNKFQEFLLLEKVKKREMLERIFYLEEYGRQLTDKFNKRLSKVRTELAGIKGAMDALGDASEKVLLEAEARMKTARETREKVDKELKLAELKFNEAKEVWNLSNDYKQAMEKERLHLSRLDDIAAKRERYENSIKAGDLGDVISKYREVSKSLTDTTALLEEVNRKLPEFEKELEDAKSRLNSNRKEADIEKPRLIEVRAKLNEALAVKKDISSIKERLVKLGENYSKLKGEISTKESEINDIKVHLEAAEKSEEDLRTVADNLKVNIDYRNELLSGVKLDEDLKNAKKEKEKLGLEINDLSRKVKELTNKLENVKAENKGLRNKLLEMKTTRVRLENQKQGDRTAILNEINNCHKIKVALETLKAKRAEVDGLRLKLDKMSIQVSKQKERLQNKQNNKAELEDILAKEKTRVEVLEERYEKNTAYMLAKNLTAGEPCPVCGSVHHPNPADKTEYPDMGKIEEQLKTAREEYSMAEQNSREAENECIKLAEQLKGLNSQVSQISNELLVKQNEYESLADQLPGYYRTMEIEKIEAAVNILAEQNNKRLEAIESREQQLNEVKNEILKLNDILSRKLADENGLKAELKVNGENLLQTQSLLKNAETEYIQCLEAYNGFLGRLGIANIQDELKRIEENDRQMEKLQSKIKQCQEKQRSLRKAQEHLEEKKTNLRNIFIEIENDVKNLEEQKSKLEEKVKELAGTKDILQELKAVEDRLNSYAKKEKQLYEHVEVVEKQFNDANTRRNNLLSQEDIFRKNMENESSRLSRLLKERGFESAEEAEKALLSKEQRDQLKVELDEYEKILRNLQASREIIERKLDNRKLTKEEWRKISADYEAKLREKDESISSFESARNNYNIVRGNFEKWADFNKSFQRLNKKLDMLEQIQKLLKGNSFIEFIAEERLRYIAREASETLGILTKYRYALEIDAEYGFIIRDNANGGVHRLVSSLSGGETFLTSLSLALALSKQIQLKGQSPLEFFFLDEGFGTLDGNLLDTVIDALGRLSTKERVIGLISHVPELKNRIARRLIVEPPAPDGHGSRVRIERG
jgi:exonuclease SbcC